jgi:hypothetical protein
MLNGEIAHISAGWRRKMGINNEYYCNHIIQKKLKENTLTKTSSGTAFFKEYMEKYRQHLLSHSQLP